MNRSDKNKRDLHYMPMPWEYCRGTATLGDLVFRCLSRSWSLMSSASVGRTPDHSETETDEQLCICRFMTMVGYGVLWYSMAVLWYGNEGW